MTNARNFERRARQDSSSFFETSPLPESSASFRTARAAHSAGLILRSAASRFSARSFRSRFLSSSASRASSTAASRRRATSWTASSRANRAARINAWKSANAVVSSSTASAISTALRLNSRARSRRSHFTKSP